MAELSETDQSEEKKRKAREEHAMTMLDASLRKIEVAHQRATKP